MDTPRNLDFDADGLMLPPWIRFPNLPKTPVGWWRGDQNYRADFRKWWEQQPPATRLLIQERYPEPPEWDLFYFIVQMKCSDLDAETRRIWELIGALSDALWRRAREEPGFSMLDHLLRSVDEYRAESEEEIAIWNELTGPQNYRAIIRYVEQTKGSVNDYAQKFHLVILESARRRWESERGQGEPAG
jgi:hypothetical protein